MDQIIYPARVSGILKAPPSKSFSQRACAAALLHSGKTTLSNYGKSDDEQTAINIISDLGAKVTIEEKNDEVEIISSDAIFSQRGAPINCGESGLSMRLFAPIAALFTNEIIFNGHGSILTRPMNFFDEIFPALGVKIKSNHGKLPISITGPINAPSEFAVDGSLSSQFLTGLLFALSKAITQPTSITVHNLQSKPYIDISLSVLKDFGINITHTNYEVFELLPFVNHEQRNIHYTIEGDWSGAAFLCVAAAIAGQAVITDINCHSLQGDRKILEVLQSCGVEIVEQERQLTVTHNDLQGFTFDATHCPDLFPPLVALAANCHNESLIKGVNRLTHKESNRALSLKEEFEKMNIQIELNDDIMRIIPGDLRGANVHSHNDHRIAMACAVAALNADGKTVIKNSEAINKSYPAFFDDLRLLTTV